jgi:hypothetical protein
MRRAERTPRNVMAPQTQRAAESRVRAPRHYSGFSIQTILLASAAVVGLIAVLVGVQQVLFPTALQTADSAWQQTLRAAELQLAQHPWPFLASLLALLVAGVVCVGAIAIVALLLLNMTGDLLMLLRYGKTCLCASAKKRGAGSETRASARFAVHRQRRQNRKLGRAASDPQLKMSAPAVQPANAPHESKHE